jgi:hypothetical protein
VIYRKRGHTVRWENGVQIRVTERGVAHEEGALFTCHPDPGDAEEIASLGEVLLPRVDFEASGATVERLIASRGIAQHRYGEREWIERSDRLHVSLTHRQHRALIDQATFDTMHIERVANALVRAEEAERQQPARLRLAANVAAALLPPLIELAPPNVRVVQTAGGIDGKGNDIIEATGDWPNWYRPSYRVRPVRVPLNVRLECTVHEVDPSRPVAIALLGPVLGLTLRVLIEDGARVYPSTIRITRIDAVADERTWYPYGAGSFGAEMML